MPIYSGTFSMKTFMEKVKQANWHFTLSKSSLWSFDYAGIGVTDSLINTLGGAYDKAKGADTRTLNRTDLMKVQGIIWPQGVGATTKKAPWTLKKEKYRAALGYLVNALFNLDEADALLVGTYKTGYSRRTLTQDMHFVTAKGVTPQELTTSGRLSSGYATELCIPDQGLVGDWPEHKFIFAKPMKTKNDGITLVSAGAIKGQGFGNNIYCFKRPATTPYYCTQIVDPNSTGATEVAFPGDVPISYIKVYAQGKPLPQQHWNPSNF
ncbi:MAG: hypothetical protein JNL62_07110 [Bryobacterales bacterium]|nr:hypothetical protein [Bryobacterales bacterium]